MPLTTPHPPPPTPPQSLTLQRLHELSGDSLLTVLYAFARTSPPPHPPRLLPDPRIAARMEAATLPSVATFTPRQLQHAALSLSRLRHNPGEQWLAGFATALEAGWGGFGPVALGETLVAAAEMGLTRLGRVCISEQLPGLVCRMAAEGAMAAASAEAEAVLTGLGRAGTGAGVGLRLQDGGGGSGAGGWGDVRTLVALVWACGHFGCGPPSAQCTQDVLAATWRDIGGGGSSSYAASSSSGNTSSSGSAAAATITHSQSASSSDGGARGDPGRQEPGEEAGGRQGGGAGLCAGDAVLLLHGLACMGVRPPGAWTGRLLGPGGALGPGELGALGVVGLGWAAWSVLKVGEGPPDRAWVDALAGRVVEAVGQELGQGEGGEAEGKEGEAGRGWEGEGGPGDVALALVSLVGLGGHVGACAEVEAYWRGGRRWGALTGAERATLAALGYAPGAGAGAG